MNTQCDIIIPVWNQLAFTKDCINSVLANTSGDYRIIIIDNASGDETKHYLEGLKASTRPQILVIRNEENVGFVKAVNHAIAASSAPYVCLLNNDTLVTKDWLKIMLDIMNRQKEIAIVNPASNNLGQRPANGEPIELYAQALKKDADKFIELGAAIGFCMLIKKEVIDRIGPFDEIYGMGNFEDTDFSRRAVKEGYRCVEARGAYVYHRESSSFSKVKSFENDFKRNKEIYEFRWGRPNRIAYILSRYDDNILRRLSSESLKSARLGNWIWYISKDPISTPSHANIHFVRVPDKWFFARAVFMVLKKKKKFSDIFVDNEKLAAVLNRLKFIHKANVNYY